MIRKYLLFRRFQNILKHMIVIQTLNITHISNILNGINISKYEISLMI